MKKLLYLLGVVTCLSFLVISCETQDIDEPQLKDATVKGKKDKISICHLDEYGNWIVINVSENALPAHLAHGDMINQLTPMVGKYTVKFYQDGSATPTSSKMIVVDVLSDGTFTGYGSMTAPPNYAWVIENGTYDEDGNISLRVNYTTIQNYLDCKGTYFCGDGYTGAASINGGPYTSAWEATLDPE